MSICSNDRICRPGKEISPCSPAFPKKTNKNVHISPVQLFSETPQSEQVVGSGDDHVEISYTEKGSEVAAYVLAVVDALKIGKNEVLLGIA